jgi:DNA-binding transcriptional LysR family regulator
MDTLQNMKAFLVTAQTGSFSEAARKLGVATSVVTKRVKQLEGHLKTRLLDRSTRRVSLTETGEKYLPKISSLVTDSDELRAGILTSSGEMEGHIRLMAPTTLSVTYLGLVLSRFQQAHPRVTIDLISIDRPNSPIVEGFDMAIAVLPTSYDGVVEETLCAYPRIVCASPAYLERRGVPHHPRDLAGHDCLVFLPAGPVWPFQSPRGPLNVNVRVKFGAADSFSLLSAARAGNGITFITKFIAAPALESGELVQVLKRYPVAKRWVKALVPESRAKLARVQALMKWLKAEFAPRPPWERA